ncbi:MAG TPA: hypothetical protein PKH54_00885 [Myxococcota bacterium]|nr:hypothetical protein [Myxococcota bacterium]HOC98468.1 hypothetical protein [Myxococcota bacterium]HOH77280.1 hypothetical protein [Myxococcota bacterium]HPV03057.1 hypothetical protein [Myxococcota bacterium]
MKTADVATRLSVATLFVVLCGCGDSTAGSPDSGNDAGGEQWKLEWVGDGMPGTVAASGQLELSTQVTLGDVAQSGVTVSFEIVFGGGMISQAAVVTDASGIASTTWTAGPISGRAVLRASIDQAAVFIDHHVDVAAVQPLVPQPFGDVGALLEGAGIDGSTEGLVFDDAGRLFLAVPGNLVAMRPDGTAQLVPVDGDGLTSPLGMAWDYLRKVIWVADAGSVRKVSISEVGGTITATATTMAGFDGLVTPNSVAIADNRYVYFTDSCTGGVYRFQPDADTVVLETVAMFDVTVRGGPNGLAFDGSGLLWVTTENVGLLCPDSGADVTLNHGGLYSIDLSGGLAGGPVQPTPRLEGFAMFGDGLAFDADGTMYVIFDMFDGFTLTDSSVWVVPASADEPPYKVISAPVPDGATSPDRLIANIAWGYDEFGSSRLYMSLLAVVLVVSERGAMVVDVGIGGQSLLPADLP